MDRHDELFLLQKKPGCSYSLWLPSEKNYVMLKINSSKVFKKEETGL